MIRFDKEWNEEKGVWKRVLIWLQNNRVVSLDNDVICLDLAGKEPTI